MPDVPCAPLGRKPGASQNCEHLRLRIGREPELAAELAVVGEGGAGEADDGAAEEAALPGKGEERLGVGDGAQVRRDHVGENEAPIRLELGAPEPEQTAKLLAGEV